MINPVEITSHYLTYTFYFIPQGHSLVWDVPQSELAIQRTTQEIAIILCKHPTPTQLIVGVAMGGASHYVGGTYSGVECNSSDKINMLKTAKTLFPGDVPQSATNQPTNTCFSADHSCYRTTLPYCFIHGAR